jgi:hypothetical protein
LSINHFLTAMRIAYQPKERSRGINVSPNDNSNLGALLLPALSVASSISFHNPNAVTSDEHVAAVLSAVFNRRSAALVPFITVH